MNNTNITYLINVCYVADSVLSTLCHFIFFGPCNNPMRYPHLKIRRFDGYWKLVRSGNPQGVHFHPILSGSRAWVSHRWTILPSKICKYMIISAHYIYHAFVPGITQKFAYEILVGRPVNDSICIPTFVYVVLCFRRRNEIRDISL